MTRFAHPAAGILAHSSIQTFSRSFRLRLSLGNMDFQLTPKIFYWVQVWRLARPLQDLEMFLTEPLLSCPGCVFRVVVMLEDPAGPIFNALTEGRRLLAKNSRYMAPSILHSIRCSRPVPFAEKHPQRMMFPPPCFTVGMVFLGLYSSFFLQTQRVEFRPKSSICLRPHDLVSFLIQMVIGRLQMGLDVLA